MSQEKRGAKFTIFAGGAKGQGKINTVVQANMIVTVNDKSVDVAAIVNEIKPADSNAEFVVMAENAETNLIIDRLEQSEIKVELMTQSQTKENIASTENQDELEAQRMMLC